MYFWKHLDVYRRPSFLSFVRLLFASSFRFAVAMVGWSLETRTGTLNPDYFDSTILTWLSRADVLYAVLLYVAANRSCTDCTVCFWVELGVSF